MLPAVAVAVLALAASASAGAGVEHSLELLEPTQMRLGASMDDASITLSATTVKNNDFVDITVKSNIAPSAAAKRGRGAALWPNFALPQLSCSFWPPTAPRTPTLRSLCPSSTRT